jgi:predicted AAA+ superfamily ATPase
VIASSNIAHHWRSHGGAEVDLLLERDARFYPIEIKLTSRPGKGHARGIQALRETYPHLRFAPGLVIAPCEQSLQLTDHAWALPWDTL